MGVIEMLGIAVAILSLIRAILLAFNQILAELVVSIESVDDLIRAIKKFIAKK